LVLWKGEARLKVKNSKYFFCNQEKEKGGGKLSRFYGTHPISSTGDPGEFSCFRQVILE